MPTGRSGASPPAAAALRISSAGGRGLLITTILASGMVFLDSTVANVATRRIGIQFHATFTQLQWVLNGYALALASLILLGGSLGDRFGRRRVFVVGVCWFSLASLGCALAPTVHLLIAARVVQGVGGALLTPGSLALIQASFAAEDRGRAVGRWSGLTGLASASGPLLGGYLVQHVSWRWAFAINVPLGVLVVLLAMKWVPESRGHQTGALDLNGTVLGASALIGLTYGTTAAGGTGWGAVSTTSTVSGVLLLIVFVAVEARSRHPLVPPRLFMDRTFTGANLMTFTTYGSLGAVLFLFVLELQIVAGYGPLAAGVATLPITVLMLLFSGQAGALATRIGPRWPMTVGPILAAAGIALTARIDESHHYYPVDVLPAMVLFGAGMTCLVAPLTATVMAAVPADDVGVGSGINNAVARSAALLAVAVLPPLAGLTGDAYEQAAVMVHGYRITVAICVAILLIGAGVVTLTVRSPLVPAADR
ncbi:MAG: drug resistance transporter, EmrB/QacA subfamily [Frankiales bacterium]|nr:drug resistance transporter, EmrB/QacA subfamily [Frankiales bacterium]